MTGQLDLYGIFVPSFAVLSLCAYPVFRLLASALGTLGFYRAVWHRPLFNLALYVIVLGALSLLIQWFQYA